MSVRVGGVSVVGTGGCGPYVYVVSEKVTVVGIGGGIYVIVVSGRVAVVGTIGGA